MVRSRLAIALVSLAIASAASVSAAQVTTTYTYDPQGQGKAVARPSGAVAYTYDAAGNRTALGASYPAPTAVNSSLSVAFNGADATVALPVGGYVTGAAIVTAPAHGYYVVTGTTATYTPNGLYSGPDSFTYTATGPGGTSALATVSVTVGAPPPNNPPTAVNDGAVQIRAGDTVNVNVTANDSDPDGDTLSIVSLSKTTSTKADYSFSGGTITVMAKSSKGSDSLTYTITDGKGGTATATLSINVTF
ncbi:hypothetical protein ASD21_16890 [Caulobacter sp. Root1455]|nr:hypothetical protein ASD21_16890 [Caulobacter sp. Root1455]